MRAYAIAANQDLISGTLLHLALDTGMRRADLAGLKWSAVDLARQTIKVQEVLTCTRRRGKIIHAPKTKAGIRTISISKITSESLRQWKKRQEMRKQNAGDQYHDGDLVFPRMDGLPGTPGAIYQRIQRFRKRWNLPKVALLDIRRTTPTLLLLNGHDPKQVSIRMGHANTRVTMDIYAQINTRAQQGMGETYDALNENLSEEESGV